MGAENSPKTQRMTHLEPAPSAKEYMFIKELQQGHAAQLKTPQVWVLGDFFPLCGF